MLLTLRWLSDVVISHVCFTNIDILTRPQEIYTQLARESEHEIWAVHLSKSEHRMLKYVDTMKQFSPESRGPPSFISPLREAKISSERLIFPIDRHQRSCFGFWEARSYLHKRKEIQSSIAALQKLNADINCILSNLIYV